MARYGEASAASVGYSQSISMPPKPQSATSFTVLGGEALAPCLGGHGWGEVRGLGPAAFGEEDFNFGLCFLGFIEFLDAAEGTDAPPGGRGRNLVLAP